MNSMSFGNNHLKLLGHNGQLKKKRILSDPDLSIKKKKKSHKYDLEHGNPGIKTYKNNKNYMSVVARPDFPPPVPKIFQQDTDKIKNGKRNESREAQNIISKFLSAKCFDVDVSKRYSFLEIPQKLESKKSVKDVKEAEDIEDIEDGEVSGQEANGKSNRSIQEISSVQENIEVEEIRRTSSVDMYNVLRGEAIIFHIIHPSTFSFQGELKVTLISGEVEILGYTLTASEGFKTVDVFSPAYCLPLKFESKIPQHTLPLKELKNYLKDILTDFDMNKLLSKLQPNDSILLLERANSRFGKVVSKYFDKPLFPLGVENISGSSVSLEKLESIFNITVVNAREFKKNPEWDAVLLGRKTVLCGGKNVGKSTLLKYYANKLLSNGEKVVCLDFDPGQPEFAAPGCLTAVLLDEPLLGPNFTHVLEPKVMAYFGDINVTVDPEKYLDCVKLIIDFCKNDEEISNAKWLVNTMGFTKGLGEKFMVSVFKLLQPDTVIQIRSLDMRWNYPQLFTPSTVNRLEGLKTVSSNQSVSFDLSVITSWAERGNKQLQGGLMPRQLRDIMSISYFSRMVSPPHHNFNAVRPYVIPFSKIYLGIQFSVSPQYILKAFNGNTVSLSHFEPTSEEILSLESDPESYFKIVINSKVSLCLGLGFVRGIDCEAKTFYVISHLPSEEMSKVNCLSLGRVSPPHSLFLKQDTVNGSPMYTSICSQSVIQRVKRMFRVPVAQQMKQSKSFQR